MNFERVTSVSVFMFALALTACGLMMKAEKKPEEKSGIVSSPSEETPKSEPELSPPPPPDDPLLGVLSMGGAGAKKAFLDSKEGVIALKKAKNNAKKIEKAKAKIEKALEADPDIPDGRYNLARALSRQGDTAAAADALIEAMKICLPCTAGMEDETDLEALRASSDDWKRVQKERATYEGAWKRALSSPGVFLLVGLSRSVRDQTWGGVEKDRRDRGRVCFYHASTGRLLPLGLGRDVAGFVLDRENHRLHALKWAKFFADTDVGPASYDAMAVMSLDLHSYDAVFTRITESVSGIGLWVQDGNPTVRYLAVFAVEGEEIWYTAKVSDGKLTDVQKGKSDYTPTTIDPMSDKKMEKLCAKRTTAPESATDYFFLDAAFCGNEFPPPGGKDAEHEVMTCASLDEDESLCHTPPAVRSTDGYEGQDSLVVLDAEGKTREITKPDMVIQMAVP